MKLKCRVKSCGTKTQPTVPHSHSWELAPIFCPASSPGSEPFSPSGEGMRLGSNWDILRSIDGPLSTVNVSLLLHNRTARLKNYYSVNLKAVQSWILCTYILALANHIMAEFCTPFRSISWAWDWYVTQLWPIRPRLWICQGGREKAFVLPKKGQMWLLPPTPSPSLFPSPVFIANLKDDLLP